VKALTAEAAATLVTTQTQQAELDAARSDITRLKAQLEAKQSEPSSPKDSSQVADLQVTIHHIHIISAQLKGK
jgi:multidrug efflux pump subunit AcrA (membrane-fusion protein)